MTTLTVLGSGAAVPAARRAPPGVLITTGSGDSFLVDPGPGALHRSVVAGASVKEIKTVFLTHHHPDHTLDLVSLLFARHSVLLRPDLEPLVVVGPIGTQRLYERIVGLYGRWVEAPDGDLEIVELDPAEGGVPIPAAADVEGIAVAVEHSGPCQGYRFAFSDGTIAISGDTGDCAGLDRLGRDADIFLLECSVPDEHEGTGGHMSPAGAGRAAARIGPRKLVLCHLYPPVSASAAKERVSQFFGGDVVVAEDGDTFAL